MEWKCEKCFHVFKFKSNYTRHCNYNKCKESVEINNLKSKNEKLEKELEQLKKELEQTKHYNTIIINKFNKKDISSEKIENHKTISFNNDIIIYNDNNNNIELKIKSSPESINKLENIINNVENFISDYKEKLHKPSKRKSIPKAVRDKLWIAKFGKSFTGKCMVCDLEITMIAFHVGHIKSIKNGGSNNINNLELICINCNLSMGSQNLCEYKNDYHDSIIQSLD